MAILSSHVLNSTDGTHAAGVRVMVINRETGEVMLDSQTDSGGRLWAELDLAAAAEDTRYELVIHTGAFWAATATRSPHHQTVDEIVIRLRMPEPAARYHVPIIISPNGYSAWWSQPE